MIVAAVQMNARIGDVPGNIERAERLARDAFEKGARWVVLPEFFTSPVGYDDALRRVALPPDGPAAGMMARLAREYHGVIGGSFITAEGGDAFNRFVLSGPDGVLGRHDKDQPTMWENAYYIGGTDDGIIGTPLGPVGAALCWELVRCRTARRLRGRVDLVVGGSCWWSVPDAGPLLSLLSSVAGRNREIMRATPGRFARLVGAPLVHASHCGRFACGVPYVPMLPYRSFYLGEAQVVAADGTILARRTFEEGEGVVTARVTVGRTPPLDPIPERFWIPDLPPLIRAAWSYQNFHGVRRYRRVKKNGGFNWQRPDWDAVPGGGRA